VQGAGWTLIDTDDDAFAASLFVSELNSETVAVFVIVVPSAEGLTSAAIASVAVAFGLSAPMSQTPVDISYIPTDAEAFDKLRPAGRMSFTWTMLDVAGPRAFTVIK
jgi:hypothetical protein